MILWKQLNKTELIQLMEIVQDNVNISNTTLDDAVERMIGTERLQELKESCGKLSVRPEKRKQQKKGKSKRSENAPKSKRESTKKRGEETSSFWDRLYAEEVSSSDEGVEEESEESESEVSFEGGCQ